MSETITNLIAEARDGQQIPFNNLSGLPNWSLAYQQLRELSLRLADACEQLQAHVSELEAANEDEREHLRRALDIGVAKDEAARTSRKKALLDAAGDVCGICSNRYGRADDDQPMTPHARGLQWFHGEKMWQCDAGPIHRRIKEEGLS